MFPTIAHDVAGLTAIPFFVVLYLDQNSTEASGDVSIQPVFRLGNVVMGCKVNKGFSLAKSLGSCHPMYMFVQVTERGSDGGVLHKPVVKPH